MESNRIVSYRSITTLAHEKADSTEAEAERQSCMWSSIIRNDKMSQVPVWASKVSDASETDGPNSRFGGGDASDKVPSAAHRPSPSPPAASEAWAGGSLVSFCVRAEAEVEVEVEALPSNTCSAPKSCPSTEDALIRAMI